MMDDFPGRLGRRYALLSLFFMMSVKDIFRLGRRCPFPGLGRVGARDAAAAGYGGMVLLCAISMSVLVLWSFGDGAARIVAVCILCGRSATGPGIMCRSG